WPVDLISTVMASPSTACTMPTSLWGKRGSSLTSTTTVSPTWMSLLGSLRAYRSRKTSSDMPLNVMVDRWLSRFEVLLATSMLLPAVQNKMRLHLDIAFTKQRLQLLEKALDVLKLPVDRGK